MSVLVAGSVAYDGIETPFGEVDRVPGGSASYISLSASYFADPVRLLGVVGNDFEDKDMQTFKDHGVVLDGLEVDEDGKTFYWKGKYKFDLEERETLETQLNVLETFDPQLPDSYKDSKYIALGNLDPGQQMEILDQVEDPDYVVLDTMNLWIENTLDNLKKAISQTNMLIINDSEARELSDEPNLLKAADKIRDMGTDNLIIKKGEHGALLFTDDTYFSIPAYPVVDIYDPTGAGDSFLGGFVGYLANTDDLTDRNLRRACVFGSVMSSYCVEEFGPGRLSELSKEDISKRYKEFMEISQIPKQEYPFAK
jgi:sugar/nucleoside kinase (ribokinase family)